LEDDPEHHDEQEGRIRLQHQEVLWVAFEVERDVYHVDGSYGCEPDRRGVLVTVEGVPQDLWNPDRPQQNEGHDLILIERQQRDDVDERNNV